eukprot:c3535_g1_i2 orf=671-910(-)
MSIKRAIMRIPIVLHGSSMAMCRSGHPKKSTAFFMMEMALVLKALNGNMQSQSKDGLRYNSHAPNSVPTSIVFPIHTPF